ncbi:hypothetical protein IGI04_004352 [Brassica rapa subsp. trilocularis]|uniref:NYN domain-containing protein n=1 Tax=Brassica rapa subsp. trilocularis TaxID=1813537 RepID=A0ABQ7NAV8_BRACM|nr:hypothetical protein IGI04_004352 [Brassica rapa subsp. trilocularis]
MMLTRKGLPYWVVTRRGLPASTFSPENWSYEASLVLFADQFIGAGYYTDMLRRLDAMDYDLLLVTPTLDINNPESPQWPGLFIDRGAACFAVETSKISQEPPSPKKHEADAAAEEETLNTHGKLLLETEDIKKPESPELPAGSTLGRWNIKVWSKFVGYNNTSSRCYIRPNLHIGSEERNIMEVSLMQPRKEKLSLLEVEMVTDISTFFPPDIEYHRLSSRNMLCEVKVMRNTDIADMKIFSDVILRAHGEQKHILILAGDKDYLYLIKQLTLGELVKQDNASSSSKTLVDEDGLSYQWGRRHGGISQATKKLTSMIDKGSITTAIDYLCTLVSGFRNSRKSVPQAPKMQRVRNTLSGKNGSIDVFINLETTTIDSSDGPKLRAHIGTVLGKKYHSRFMTVYAIRTPDETLVKSLYQGKKIVLKPISKEKSSATSVNSVKVSVIMH